MFSTTPLHFSQLLLAALGVRVFISHADRIPTDSALLVVSNHRSFMDAPVLMTAINRPIRFACHHYMGQVPVMRQIVESWGAFPLAAPSQRQVTFFDQATQLLRSRQVVGLFPEGASPMVKPSQANEIGRFHRGFAHLALQAPVTPLAVLPIAIASLEEQIQSTIPLKLLSWFDPSEPLFNQPGQHPMVIYQHLNIAIGRPYWILPQQRQLYQNRQLKASVNELSNYCRSEILNLLATYTQ